MPNQLASEKSPYLLQHKENPVDWLPWGSEAFARAAREDKPILLSIGYSTCHWCHVMAHESFEDAEVAARLNRDFVCIKVDREERPDVDAVYMAVSQAVTGAGGWPLTVFLTPEQKPFFVGTYFPKQSRVGQMGFLALLERIADLWRHERGRLIDAGEQITAVLAQNQTAAEGEPDRGLLRQAYAQFCTSYDERYGGFGRAPKFPTPHQLLFLLTYAEVEREPAALRMAERTLDAMARGGIHDQIGGGFSRYSTDARWLAPHFEKMLYDNALLLLAYLRGHQQTGRSDFADVARRTADYILRELTDPAGGFYCGQDADSDGVEGKYYLFTPEEVTAVLGAADGEAFCRLYDITPKGNFEGKSIPNRLGQVAPPWPAEDARLQKLYDYRRRRTALHRDDKVLLAWNGWAMLALAQAGLILDEPRYLAAAVRAQRFLEANMTDGQNRLWLRWREGEAANAGQLDDYAVYALALLELYRATFDPYYLEQAILRAGQMEALFADHGAGGCFINADDAEQLITRPKESYDGAIPSGNAAAAMVFEALAHLTGDPAWRAAADRQHRFLAGQMRADGYPAGHTFALLAMTEALYPHRELVCVGEGDEPTLTAYLRRNPPTGLCVLRKTAQDAARLESCAPFTGAYPLPARGTMWYLCENGACRAPVREFGLLGLAEQRGALCR